MIQDPDHAFGCLLHALFRPKPTIFRHFNRAFLRTILKQKHIIGIHVRVGDSLITHYKKHNNNSNKLELMRLFANVWKCATEISTEMILRIRHETSTSFLSSEFNGYSKNITWLVVSDSVDLRRVLESSSPKYVVFEQQAREPLFHSSLYSHSTHSCHLHNSDLESFSYITYIHS